MNKNISLGPSAHVDSFARDHLPPPEQWPALLLDRPEFQYPERLNVGVELTDKMVERGFGDHTALIRSGNNPALVAAWLAASKAGAVVVNTMPLLRAGELGKIVDKAEIKLALTDSRIADELVACARTSRFRKQVVNFDGTSNHD